jgi:hypothetical protein
MKNLIKGQTIRIDNHSKGDGMPLSWDLEKIHIHKIMNYDRYNGANFSVYFDSKKPIKFNKVKGKSELIETHLRNEITNAFKSKTKRAEFAKFIASKLSNYTNELSYSSKLQELENAAKQIGAQFGLKDNVQIEIEKIYKDEILGNIKQLTTKIIDKEGKSYFILQDISGENIIIGEDLDLISDWENTVKLFRKSK